MRVKYLERLAVSLVYSPTVQRIIAGQFDGWAGHESREDAEEELSLMIKGWRKLPSALRPIDLREPAMTGQEGIFSAATEKTEGYEAPRNDTISVSNFK